MALPSGAKLGRGRAAAPCFPQGQAQLGSPDPEGLGATSVPDGAGQAGRQGSPSVYKFSHLQFLYSAVAEEVAESLL